MTEPRTKPAPNREHSGATDPRQPAYEVPLHEGPTVAECAADDKRWPLEKEGE